MPIGRESAIRLWSRFFCRDSRFLSLRFTAVVSISVMLWFLTVDWSWFVADCPDCGHGCDVAQYRFLGQPIKTDRRERQSGVEMVLADLGVPCLHTNTTRWHKHRYWGLVYLAFPRINGIVRLSGDTRFHTPALAQRLRRVGIEQPQLARMLRDRALNKHDYRGFWTIVRQLTI